jgi:exopolyphosphatase / guanosine-5'-triphosphate,3'-diphosphate pyrophosphatase
MTTIVPRWEWRTFGDGLGEASKALAALGSERVEESNELYLLSTAGDESVKVRAEVLDLKLLDQRTPEGLELWHPELKASFPLAAADLHTVLAALGTPVPLTRAAYTLPELVEEVIGPAPGLIAVEVHKHRRHFELDGCLAESTELTTAAGTAHTIAIESEDPERVLATRRRLGLDGRVNLSVARGLKALVRFGGRRYGVLDVGTNSVKFTVGELEADGTWITVAERAEVTRLGEGLSASGRLGAEPIARTVEAFASMVAEARDAHALEIAAVGTAGLRIAGNSAELIDAVRERTGIEVEVIPGEEEARLAFFAVTAGLAAGGGPVAVFDTGGGSSQFTFGHGSRIEEQFSVNVGAASFTELFGLGAAVSPERLDEALHAIGDELARLDGRKAPETLVGLGGAVTNLAAVKLGLTVYDPDAVRGSRLDRAEIDRQIELYRALPASGRSEIPGLQQGRGEVILAGACIVKTVLAKLGADSLVISDRGLRHGLLVERFGL